MKKLETESCKCDSLFFYVRRDRFLIDLTIFVTHLNSEQSDRESAF